MADRKRKSSKRGLPRIEDGPDLDTIAAGGLRPDEIFLPTERRTKGEPMEEQPIAACGPSPEDTDGRVKVFGFRQHDELDVAPFKGTPQCIARYMMATPIAGTGEEVDASLLDDEGFYRPKSKTKSSAETS